MIRIKELDDISKDFSMLSMQPLIITAHLRPGGRIVANDPIHLDGLLARCVIEMATGGGGVPNVADDGYWIPLPLKLAWQSEEGFPLWDCSVFLPRGPVIEDVFYRHKRTSHGTRSDTSRVKTVVGRWMERRLPLPVQVCDVWQARCIGNRGAILELLEIVDFLGKHRAIGFGEIERWTVERGDFETAIIIDGRLAHAIPESAAVILPRSPAQSPTTCIGWTPPQWKVCLQSPGWRVETELRK